MMKIILAVTAVSLVFMVKACKTSDQNITPTTNSTNTITNLKPSSLEIYDTFIRLKLKIRQVKKSRPSENGFRPKHK
jgi:hypothetical protein